MELEFNDKKIIFKKELSNLDKFVRGFVQRLEKNQIKYVIISGYVAIFFGRTRNTEDVDAFIENLNEEEFIQLWNDLIKEYDCLNTSDSKEAYEYLKEKLSLRFADKGTIMPNMEIKFAKSERDRFVLADRILVKNNGFSFFTSNIEMQIAFKVYMGSEKDLEDAEHLWLIFKEKLNKEKLKYFLSQLGVKEKGVLNGL